MIVTEKYVRKPLYVDVVRVDAENMIEIARWCQGEIRNFDNEPLSDDVAENQQLERYIHVRVHNPKNARQTKAHIGDYLLYTERGYKVYTERAFQNSFELVEGKYLNAEDVEPVAVPEVTPQDVEDLQVDLSGVKATRPETELPNG